MSGPPDTDLTDDEWRASGHVYTPHGWIRRQDMKERVRAFLTELEAVCRRHNLSIAHEDHEGAFLVVPFSARDKEWLRQATWWDGKPKRCGRPVEGETCIMTPGHGPPCRRRRLRRLR